MGSIHNRSMRCTWTCFRCHWRNPSQWQFPVCGVCIWCINNKFAPIDRFGLRFINRNSIHLNGLKKLTRLKSFVWKKWFDCHLPIDMKTQKEKWSKFRALSGQRLAWLLFGFPERLRTHQNKLYNFPLISLHCLRFDTSAHRPLTVTCKLVGRGSELPTT